MTQTKQALPHCAKGEKYVRSTFEVHLRFGAWCNWSENEVFEVSPQKAASEFNSSRTHLPQRDKRIAKIPRWWNCNFSYFSFSAVPIHREVYMIVQLFKNHFDFSSACNRCVTSRDTRNTECEKVSRSFTIVIVTWNLNFLLVFLETVKELTQIFHFAVAVKG